MNSVNVLCKRNETGYQWHRKSFSQDVTFELNLMTGMGVGSLAEEVAGAEAGRLGLGRLMVHEGIQGKALASDRPGFKLQFCHSLAV